jgi:hypothetical protein
MVTKQQFKRLAALILVVVHGLVAGMPVHAGDWMPMLPSQDFYDFQLFAPPDLQEYEIYPEPSEGIFFNYDRLYWGITPPRVAGVAQTAAGNYLIPYQPISPQTIVTLNNQGIAAAATSGTSGSVIGGLYTFGTDPLQLELDTSWMRTRMAWGNRYEGGWIYDNNGVPKIDPKTKQPIMRDALDPDTKLRMLNEMLQYTQPKLKAVEMKVSGHLDLTNEQLDSRLEMLFAKAMK